MLIFDGFLRVYIESVDDEDQNGGQKGLLPALTAKQILRWDRIQATEKFTQKPPRYTEASLVKKLEELGIGRPSTYANIITKIQERKYVDKVDLEGEEKETNIALMKPGSSIKWSKSKHISLFTNKQLFLFSYLTVLYINIYKQIQSLKTSKAPHSRAGASKLSNFTMKSPILSR